MPRSVKHGGKKKKRYVKKVNLTNARRRSLKKKKNATTYCEEIASGWKKNKTIKQNLESMGLIYDVNKALNLLPKSNDDVDVMDVEEAAAAGNIDEQLNGKSKLEKRQTASKNGDSSVVAKLEKVVADATIRNKQGRKFYLMPKDIDFCVHLIKRYGDDYEAMSRDPKNIYQNTPQQIQRKIRIFKRSPEYRNYFNDAGS
uniref:Nucleolar protein 16 n=1 Tax=Syphacia muris TaxID=451379 RepID=A0A0N5AYQ6_9BILA